MKYAIVFIALFAVALARPNDVEVTRNFADVGAEAFKFGYATSDGSSHDAEGVLKNVGTEAEASSIRGSYSFVDTEGKVHKIDYIADENGFQPSGEDVPKPVV